MSTATHLETIDMTKPGVPMSRLIKVELRKTVDTLAGRWLLIAIAVITVIVNVIVFFVAKDQDKNLANFMGASGAPQGILLPVLGILLVTSEWSQRTGMVTFTLAPQRIRTVWAKIVSAVVLGTGAFVVAMAVGTLMTAVSGGTDPWNIGIAQMGQFYLGQLIGILQGVAFGLLILISAAAIVASFAIPIVFSVVTGLWTAIRDAQPWIDLGTNQNLLFGNEVLTGKEWTQLLVTSIIWLFVPLGLGILRLLRSEVK
ncbi:MAG: ABC transporter permease [Aeromicrobium sp.]